jgi:hypothetical protein
MFGRVYYSVLDLREQIRGAVNVIGGGLGIFTTEGPDESIDDAVRMLQSKNEFGYDWVISHRNRVQLDMEVLPS